MAIFANNKKRLMVESPASAAMGGQAPATASAPPAQRPSKRPMPTMPSDAQKMKQRFNQGGAGPMGPGRGTPRTIQRGSGPISPDYGRGKKGPSLLDQALEAVQGMPTGRGSFSGKAGKARAQSRQIQQAEMMAKILGGAYDTERKEQGSTGRLRMQQAGRDRREAMGQAGSTAREAMEQQGESQRMTQKNKNQMAMKDQQNKWQQQAAAAQGQRDIDAASALNANKVQAAQVQHGYAQEMAAAEPVETQRKWMPQKFDRSGNLIEGTGTWSEPPPGPPQPAPNPVLNEGDVLHAENVLGKDFDPANMNPEQANYMSGLKEMNPDLYNKLMGPAAQNNPTDGA